MCLNVNRKNFVKEKKLSQNISCVFEKRANVENYAPATGYRITGK